MIAAGCWLAVASAEHVRRGRTEGFMQVCHGKHGPLARVRPGDGVAYYSPTETFGGNDRLQAFTAIGYVREDAPYQADMGGGFRPFRRDVDWLDGVEIPIAPILHALELTAGKRNWGYQLRFGMLALSPGDFTLIRLRMTGQT